MSDGRDGANSIHIKATSNTATKPVVRGCAAAASRMPSQAGQTFDPSIVLALTGHDQMPACGLVLMTAVDSSDGGGALEALAKPYTPLLPYTRSISMLGTSGYGGGPGFGGRGDGIGGGGGGGGGNGGGRGCGGGAGAALGGGSTGWVTGHSSLTPALNVLGSGAGCAWNVKQLHVPIGSPASISPQLD